MKIRETTLPEGDVQQLWERFATHPTSEVKHQLMLQYMGLVRYCINNLNLAPNAVLTEEDFLQFGILGLHEALERFELSRGIKFETYAVPRIRGIILDEVRRVDFLSRTTRKRSQEYLQAADQLRSEHGREVSSEEIRDKLKLSADEYKNYLRAAAAATSSFSLNDSQTSTDTEEQIDKVETIEDESAENALERMTEEERLQFVVTYLQKLPDRQRTLMSLYYYETLTFKEIGQVMKITESRVCQIHTSICHDLKKKLKDY